jgi:putative hydrolase of the HAD superfamily
MESPPKCVIFDLGGVVFSSPIGRLAQLEVEHGLPSKMLNTHIMNSLSWSRLEKGEIDPSTFAKEYDEEIKRGITSGKIPKILKRISGSLIMETISADDGIPRVQYIEAIESLKRMNILTCALTNNFKASAAKNDTSLNQAVITKDFFDIVVESSVVGLRKPDPKIYCLVCKKAGVHPSDCVFLDDIGYNLKPAKKLGMQTIKVMVNDENGINALYQLENIIGSSLFLTGRRKRSKM